MRALDWGGGERHIARVNYLLKRIKGKLPELEHWIGGEDLVRGEENRVYRFYHLYISGLWPFSGLDCRSFA